MDLWSTGIDLILDGPDQLLVPEISANFACPVKGAIDKLVLSRLTANWSLVLNPHPLPLTAIG